MQADVADNEIYAAIKRNQEKMISVLIPTNRFNGWLVQAIESVYEANFPHPIETLILANNMSEHELSSLKELQKTHPFKIVDCERDSLSDALNRGIRESSFDIVARLDSDDLVEKDRFLIQHEHLIENPSIAILASAVTVISENSDFVGYRYPPRSPSAIKALLLFGNCLVHPSIMFRKSLVLEAGAYTSNYQHAEDYDLFMRMLDDYEFSAIQMPLTKYRVFDDQISAKFRGEQLRSSELILRSYFQKRTGVSRLREFLHVRILRMRFCRKRGPVYFLNFVGSLMATFLVSPRSTAYFLANTLRNLWFSGKFA
jgi:glycosyltransferase involved in cell wall biosynthesis